MFRPAYRLMLLAGALMSGPLLTAQSLPNPLKLPDPLGITDSKDGHGSQPQRQDGRRGRRPHEDRREHRRGRHDARREDRHEDRHEDREGHHGH